MVSEGKEHRQGTHGPSPAGMKGVGVQESSVKNLGVVFVPSAEGNDFDKEQQIFLDLI